ncbi:MAG: flagellar basal body rod protein FlgB [Firmicutes bacterium]|nr:flagellar basal body rod protein FlgB [Bacillota bacterium]
MLDKLTKDFSITLLSTALKGAEARHEALANNIANANTPGYKRRDVPFQEILRKTIDIPSVRLVTTDPRHIPASRAKGPAFSPAQIVDTTATRVDGNNVNVETEMAKLAENSLLYSALAELLSRRISTLRSVIKEGGR